MEEPAERPQRRPLEVKLLDHTSDPIRSLYVAYRTAYSALTPVQIIRRIESDKITRQQMLDFIEKRMETGHASPLEQVWFEFGIAGVTRAFSHQFVRHRQGISFEQQSQRYVTFKGGEFPYTVPDSVKRHGFEDKMEAAFDSLAALYDAMVQAGIPAEDARFVLPNATHTNFKVTVNFVELLHIADLRLCTRAQWEFRKVVAMMRAEVFRTVPELGRYLQPKCGEYRQGYCDEPYGDWQACPIGKKRPHKTVLFKGYEAFLSEARSKQTKQKRKGDAKAGASLFEQDEWDSPEAFRIATNLAGNFIETQPLSESDFDVIGDEESSV